MPWPWERAAFLQAAATAGARSHEGVAACHAALTDPQLLASGRTIAIRDYWPYWRDCAEAAHAGKLLTVTLRGADDAPHMVLIDDNIRKPDGHIVDVRNAETGESLTYSEAKARGHIVTAWPYHALTDPSYFVRLIHGVLATG